MKNPSPILHCDFCKRTLPEVEFMFRSPVSATPAHICDGCIKERMSWLEMEIKSPDMHALRIVRVG